MAAATVKTTPMPLTRMPSFRSSLLAFRARYNEEEKLCSLLDDIRPELDFLRSAGCAVSFGTGAGVYDFAFLTRCTPSLRSFVSVDRDASGVDDLRRSLAAHLPNVAGVFHRTSIQDWTGPDEGADLALMFHVLHYLDAADRRTLYRRCFRQRDSGDGGGDGWLKADGCAVMLTPGCRTNLMETVFATIAPGNRFPSSDDIERELAAEGCEVVRQYEYSVDVDLSDVDDALLMFFNYLGGCSVRLDAIRDAIDAVMTDVGGKFEIFPKLMIVRRQSSPQASLLE